MDREGGLRNPSICEFWHPRRVLEPIPRGYRGMTYVTKHIFIATNFFFSVLILLKYNPKIYSQGIHREDNAASVKFLMGSNVKF